MMKFAVIGLGMAGQQHAENILKCKDAMLTAVAENDKAKHDIYRKKGISCYQNWIDLFLNETIQAVIIATPHDTHVEIAMYAAERGIHVLVEKPLAKNISHAEKLLVMAKKVPTVIMANITHCYYPPIQAAKKLIASGKLGQIIKVEDTIILPIKEGEISNWYFQKAHTGGGVALTNGVHMLARIRYLFDQSLKFKCGQAYNFGHFGDVEDTVLMDFILGEETPVHIYAAWPKKESTSSFVEELKIVGSRGMLTIQAWEGYKFNSFVNESENEEFKPYEATSTFVDRLGIGMLNVLNDFICVIRAGKKGLDQLATTFEAQQRVEEFYNSLNPKKEQNLQMKFF